MATASLALARLVLWNERGMLRSWQEGGKGFADARTEPTRQLGGVTTFLHKKLPASIFPKLGKKRYFAKGGTVSSSSRKMGTRAHRDIHHVLFCKAGPCRCPEKTAWRRPVKGTAAYGLVTAAMSFLRQHQLEPLTGETVVVCQEMGTRLDCLCRDRDKQLVLVSWKTGYDQLALTLPEQLHIPDLRVGSTRSMAPAQLAYRSHIAQLCCELHMCRQAHGLDIRRVALVYLHPNSRYRAGWAPEQWVLQGSLEMYQWLLSKRLAV
jgi:hypothetical protein